MWNFGYNQNIFGCSEDYLLQNVWKVSDGWSGGLLPGGQPVNKFWKCVQTSCLLLKIFKPVAFCWKFSNQLPFVKLSEKKGTLGYVLHFENIHLKWLTRKYPIMPKYQNKNGHHIERTLLLYVNIFLHIFLFSKRRERRQDACCLFIALLIARSLPCKYSQCPKYLTK